MAEEVSTKTAAKTKTRKGWKLARKSAVVLLVIGLAAFGGYYFKKYNDLKNNPLDSAKAVELENKKYVSAVSKLYDVPTDDQPEIYKIVDKNQLSDEIKNYGAENNDIVLLYKNAKLLIIYRPSTNKLIKATPVNLSNNTAKLKLALLGSSSARVSAEQKISDKYKDSTEFPVKKDAVGNYGSVVVVDLNGKNKENAQKIADALGGQVGNMPEGEPRPDNVDIAIVLGGQ